MVPCIYRRYGNKDPAEVDVVQLEICHVWPGENVMLTATRNAARQLLDGLGSISDVVSSYSAGPSRAIGSWAADQVAPSYWTPNAQIAVRMSRHSIVPTWWFYH